MKKGLKIAGIVLVVIIVLIVTGFGLAGGALIKGSINTLGPAVLGVPVSLEHAVFMPFRGKMKLTRLHVGNPEGFKTPSLFELGEIDIELDSLSLFSKTLVIHKISVNAPEITYERGLLASNFSTLLDHLQGGSNSDAPAPKPDAKKKKTGQKVIIEKMIVRDPKLKLSLTAAGGHALPIALGQVELTDIGKEHGGVTVADAVKIIFSVITSNIENAIRGSGSAIGSGAKAIGSGTTSAIKGAGHLIGLGRKEETAGSRETPPATNAVK